MTELKVMAFPAKIQVEGVGWLRNYYLDLFKKVMATPEWANLMQQGAFNRTTLMGKEYADWVAREEARHVALMKKAGFIAGQ